MEPVIVADILADTNILLRRINRGDPQYHPVRHALRKLVEEGYRICVTSQNLIELWTVCTRPVDSNGLGLTPIQTERVLRRIEDGVTRLPESDRIYAEWRQLVSTYNISGKKTHDARLVAAMRVHGVTHILTFNTDDFTRYSGLTVMHPANLM